MKDRILDKVVMITGATSGIGKATAEMLSELGANLIVCGRSQSKLDDLVSKLFWPY